MIAFATTAQRIVGKPVEAIMRSSRNRETIPTDIAAIVSSKYTFSVTMADESFHKPKKSYQVNAIVTAYGKQRALRLHPPNQAQPQINTTRYHGQTSTSAQQANPNYSNVQLPYTETPTRTLPFEQMALQTPVKETETSTHHPSSEPNM
jgi:replication factor A1